MTPERKLYMQNYEKTYRKRRKDVRDRAKAAYCRRNPEFRIFCGIKQRCNNPKYHSYSYYGGRGIECRLESFHDIVAAIGPRPYPEATIDRVDNDGHYEVGNIRWASRLQQIHNRRRSA